MYKLLSPLLSCYPYYKTETADPQSTRKRQNLQGIDWIKFTW